MPSFFCITVRFLNPVFHGRGSGGKPEWPPSPLRLFQALIAAAATRWREAAFQNWAAPALTWLERQPAPIIVAPSSKLGSVYRLYVPDNVGDKVAQSWSRGGTTDIAGFRTEKDVRPTHLVGGDAVHYLWLLAAQDSEFESTKGVLFDAARSVTHLGWGVDLVVGNGQILSDGDAKSLVGERWQGMSSGSAGLRIPKTGTLDALVHRHRDFLNRLPAPETFRPVPPLVTFDTLTYRRATDPSHRPFVAFSLLKPDGSGFCPFDTVRHTKVVAGMMRGAANDAAHMSGWSEDRIGRLILGHGEALGEPHRPVAGMRLAYLPLPTIEHRGGGRTEVVGAIRRALITSFTENGGDEFDWVARTLSGSNLVDERDHAVRAILARIPSTDRMVQRYVRPAAVWSTVTPMVLPGYDDPAHYRRRMKHATSADQQKRLLGRLEDRIDGLIRKAVVQAGLAPPLAEHSAIEWRKVGYWAGVDLATRYSVPEKLQRFSRWHVRITWRDSQGIGVELPGPICLGGGRFYGLGLFAAEDFNKA
jgi:CRISPR-associated protein Csb2